MNFNKQLVIGGLALVTAFSAVAQDGEVEEKKSSNFMNTLSVGGALGLSLQHGDIRQYDWYPVAKYNSERSLGGYLHVTKSINPVFSLQGQLLMGKTKGTRREHNQYAETSIMETSLNLHVNISNLIVSGNGANRKFALYTYLGMGLTSFRAIASNLSTGVVTSEYGYDGIVDGQVGEKTEATTETVFPFGAGVKYRLSSNLSLFAETSLRNLNSDRFDATVGGNANDKYSLTGLGLTYAFGDRSEDPQWNDPLEIAIDKIDGIDAKIDGLTKDDDGDGVPNINDKEAGTPEGAIVDGAGVALDIDGDRIPDYMDEEISNKGAKVDENGNELDADGDGVADSKDLEPNTEKGTLVNFQGVTISAESGSESVSSAPTPSGLPSVYFNLNSSTISYKSYAALAEIAQALNGNDKLSLSAVGHTDSSGSDIYNEKLGMRRAEAVVSHLVKVYGIDASRISAESKGKSDPLAKGAFGDVNRRVDLLIK